MQMDLAEHAVGDFLNRFDKSYEQLLYYAALPLILTPELLHYLRHHFTPQVPFVAEVDLLLSEDMCRERTFEQYTMHSNVRNYLLSEARKKIDIAEAASLLMGYLRDIERSKAYVSLNDLQAQAWSAMVYMDEYRGEAVEQIKKAFQRAAGGNNVSGLVTNVEIERLAKLTEAFSADLADYPDLLDYARHAKKFVPVEDVEDTDNNELRVQDTSSERGDLFVLPVVDDTIFRELETDIRAVQDLLDSSKVVVIQGIGGSGKTTLIAALYRDKQTLAKYKDGIFGFYVREIHDENSLAEALSTIARQLNDKVEITPDFTKAKNLLEQELIGKTCLILADGVDEVPNEIGIRAVVSAFDFLEKTASDLLITSRVSIDDINWTIPAIYTLNKIAQKVIIWFAEDSEDVAENISSRLRGVGISTELSGYATLIYAGIESELEKAEHGKAIFIVLISPDIHRSTDYTLNLLMSTHVPVLPVLVQTTEIPNELKKIKYIDHREGNNQAFVQLLDSLRRIAKTDTAIIQPPSQSHNNYVFISASRKDMDFVERLKSDLAEEDINVWFDNKGVPGGTNWYKEIENAVNNCTLAIVIISQSSRVSDFVGKEIAYLLNLKKLVIPVLTDSPSNIPSELSKLQYVDFTSDYNDGLVQLVQAVRNYLPGQEASGSSDVYKSIFAIYARPDREIVERYRQAQIAMGNEVFIDIQSLRAGENWQSQIEEAIANADLIQLFWSENAAKSKYVLAEVHSALENGKDIRPIYWQIPMPQIPTELQHIHFAYIPSIVGGSVSGIEELISMLSSSDNTIALRSAQQLRETGWLTDDSLENASLTSANLDGANLSNASLSGVNLERANLDGANLSGADLRNANLKQSNLDGANLRGTNLTSADLSEARITTLASFDEKTILPDGSRWSPETDIAQFTDANHPDFWSKQNINRFTGKVTQDQFRQLTSILLPLFGSVEDRQVLLQESFVDYPQILETIPFEGDSRGFTISLINRLIKYGRLSDDEHALEHLLSTVKEYVGEDKRREIVSLLNDFTEPIDPKWLEIINSPFYTDREKEEARRRIDEAQKGSSISSNDFSETETKSRLITPKLLEAGWDTSPFSLRQEIRLGQSFADYILYFNESPIAVVEAKRAGTDIRGGIDQAKQNASILDLRPIFVTNGEEILQVDIVNNREIRLDRFPSAESLVSTVTSDVELSGGEEPRNRTYVLGEVIQTASEIESLLIELLAQESIEIDTNARSLGRLWTDIQRTPIDIPKTYTNRFNRFRNLRNQVAHSRVEDLPTIEEMDEILEDIQELVKFLKVQLNRTSNSSQPNVDTEFIRVRDMILERISSYSIKLESVTKIGLGVTTGINRIFVIDESQRAQLIFQDNSSVEIIKPLVRGQDINKWKLDNPDEYVIYTDKEVNLSLYPAVEKYLAPHREELSARRNFDSNSWYQLTRSRKRKELETAPKIIFPRVTSKYVFSIDLVGYYPLDSTLYIIPRKNVNPYYLLGILNSNVTRFWLKSHTGGSGVPQINVTTLREILLPDIPLNDQMELSKLTEDCTHSENLDSIAQMEYRINRIVYEIYQLSDDEVDTIEELLYNR